MQTNCPNCSNRLVVDDAKVPLTPFMLKCPKCQGMVKVPGRAAQPPATPAPPPLASAPVKAEAASAPPPSVASPMGPPAPTPPPNLAPPTFSPAPPALLSPSTRVAPAAPAGTAKALVSFPSAETALAMASVLGRLGFAVDQLDAADDKLLRVQQGDYAVIASAKNGVPDERNVYRLIQTMPLEIRRRLFFVLVGDDVATGEALQAFALVADLVVQSKDAASCDRLLAQTLQERKRVYQTFWDAEDRKLEGKL
ncbi:MAG TPA: zinc-ribbon domain-containing protein [Vicinamibacteria bacterium]|nr:zinc-ribbon domain-containing protein [Vicinamibacteria bacterium]